MSQNNLAAPDGFPYDARIIAAGLEIPWAIAVSEEGKLYVTERTGSIWIMEDGAFLPEPLITFGPPFISQGEGGLMGIALDPDFSINRYIYVMHSYSGDGRIYNRVVRLLEQEDRAVVNSIILDGIPGGRVHNGGRIKIGPDRKLYITTGDSGIAELSQDITSLAGKILRIDPDGGIPDDNPFGNSPVYSLGHRNPEGLAWGYNNILYESEHGETAHDEINIIYPGANYGWPVVQGDEEAEEIAAVKPLLHSNENTWAPSGIAFIDRGPWQDRLLVACLRGERLISITLSDDGTEAEGPEAWLVNRFGRLREAVRAADGSVYLTTSNRDGRSIPEADGDRIIRLIPIT